MLSYPHTNAQSHCSMSHLLDKGRALDLRHLYMYRPGFALATICHSLHLPSIERTSLSGIHKTPVLSDFVAAVLERHLTIQIGLALHGPGP